jgi:hypothetical protein
MSAQPSPPDLVMKLAGGIFAIVLLAVFVYLLVAGGYTLRYYTHSGAGTTKGFWYSDRPDWIPQSWLDWAGNPGSFTKITSSGAQGSTILETITGVTDAKKCMLKCDKLNSDVTSPDCAGFVHDIAAKKCHFLSSIDLITPGSNTIYLYQNSGAGYSSSTRAFKKYTSNVMPSAISIPLTINNYVENNGATGCGANCYSTPECNGYEFQPSTKMCRLLTAVDTTSFIYMSGTNTYVYDPVSGVDVTESYWT